MAAVLPDNGMAHEVEYLFGIKLLGLPRLASAPCPYGIRAAPSVPKSGALMYPETAGYPFRSLPPATIRLVPSDDA